MPISVSARTSAVGACRRALISKDAKYIKYDANRVNVDYIAEDAFYIMLTSDQIRAARALVRWSARELAEKASLSLPTIQRIEVATGIPSTSAKTLDAIERALAAAGVEFIDENGGGPGVRLRKQ
jgi:hypothetical protein